MSADFDKDDLARLLAMEHAFCSLALICTSMFAGMNQIKPSNAAKMYRDAVESSVHDGAVPSDVQKLMRKHLKRLLDHVEDMSSHADKGA